MAEIINEIPEELEMEGEEVEVKADAAEKVASQAYDQGMRQAEVVVSGPGSGRETAIRALQGCGLQVLVIKDITPVPHNGCRPPKKRRV